MSRSVAAPRQRRAPRAGAALLRRPQTRKGQMEMIGLVFIVVIIVFGIVIFLVMLDKDATSGTAKTTQANTAYLTAMLETGVPECKVTFRELLQACARQTAVGSCPDSCGQLQLSLNTLVANTLEKEGRKYNISLEHTPIQNESGCKSADQKTRIISGVQVPIVLGDGRTRQLALRLCS